MNNIVLKTGYSFIAVFILVAAQFAASIYTSAQQSVALTDPGDTFTPYIPVENSNYPSPDSIVKGTVAFSTQLIDDDTSSVEYTIGLYDSASCTNLVGYISTGSNEGIFTTTWNTRTTQSTSNLGDGKYCLKTCAVFQNETALYSACSGRRITVLNNNTKPIITSTPNKTTYFEGESFTYDLNATDAEGDPLTYRLVSTPNFLTINKNTGLITSIGPLSTNGNYGVSYTVRVGVTDNLSGETFQDFTFSIFKKVTPPTSGGGGNNAGGEDTGGDTGTNNGSTDTPIDNDGGTDVPPEEEPIAGNLEGIEFTNINEQTIINESPYKIEWTFNGQEEQIHSVKVQFSGDGENWNEISSGLRPSQTSFDWNVSNLAGGEYILRLVITKKDGVQQIEESETFIVNVQSDGEQTNEALVISVSPEPNSEITEIRPEISGTLLPSLEASVDIDTFVVSLNGRDITENCSISEDNKFSCELSSDLDSGRHVVAVEFTDSSGQQAEREWTFSIVSENVDSGAVGDSTSGGLSQSAIIFIVLIICLGLVILVVPWVLYTIWSGGSSRKETTTEVNYDVTTTVPDQTGGQDDPYAQFSEYDYPDININTNYQQPAQESTLTPDYIQPYDVNINADQAQAPAMPQTNYPETDIIQPYDGVNNSGQQSNNGDFIEPEQTS